MEITTQSRVTGQGQRVIKMSGCGGGVGQRAMCWDGGQSAIYKSIRSTFKSNSDVRKRSNMCDFAQKTQLKTWRAQFPKWFCPATVQPSKVTQTKEKTPKNSLYQCLTEKKTRESSPKINYIFAFTFIAVQRQANFGKKIIHVLNSILCLHS